MLSMDERKQVKYFVGTEVEHSISHGMKTLFVVGLLPTTEIHSVAKQHDVKQIYFGTSQSFVLPEESYEAEREFSRWEDTIVSVLHKDYWVTLDFDSKYAERVARSTLNGFDRFIPMISVKLPDIKCFHYNAILKLDDTTWGYSNNGVWTHRVHDLMAIDKFTSWDQYSEDTINE